MLGSAAVGAAHPLPFLPFGNEADADVGSAPAAFSGFRESGGFREIHNPIHANPKCPDTLEFRRGANKERPTDGRSRSLITSSGALQSSGSGTINVFRYMIVLTYFARPEARGSFRRGRGLSGSGGRSGGGPPARASAHAVSAPPDRPAGLAARAADPSLPESSGPGTCPRRASRPGGKPAPRVPPATRKSPFAVKTTPIAGLCRRRRHRRRLALHLPTKSPTLRTSETPARGTLTRRKYFSNQNSLRNEFSFISADLAIQVREPFPDVADVFAEPESLCKTKKTR